MKKALVCLLAGLFCVALNAKDYTVESSHSSVEFKIKHLSVSNVKGNFGKFSGSLSLDNGKLSALNGEVDVDSINTNSEGRDAHIKDGEYFNVAKYPKAVLKLVKLQGENGLFDLTIKGITKQVSLNIEISGTSKNQSGKEVVGLSLNGKINRKDFDIAKSTPNAALGEDVILSVEIEGVAK